MKNKSNSIFSRESSFADPVVLVDGASRFILSADWYPYVAVLDAVKDDERLSGCADVCPGGLSKRDL